MGLTRSVNRVNPMHGAKTLLGALVERGAQRSLLLSKTLLPIALVSIPAGL